MEYTVLWNVAQIIIVRDREKYSTEQKTMVDMEIIPYEWIFVLSLGS